MSSTFRNNQLSSLQTLTASGLPAYQGLTKPKEVLYEIKNRTHWVGHAKNIKCTDGFEYDSQSGKLIIDMNSYTDQLDSYLDKSHSHRKYYVDNIY